MNLISIEFFHYALTETRHSISERQDANFSASKDVTTGILSSDCWQSMELKRHVDQMHSFSQVSAEDLVCYHLYFE